MTSINTIVQGRSAIGKFGARLSLFLFLAFLSRPLCAEDVRSVSGIYRGTIGGQQIVLEMVVDDFQEPDTKPESTEDRKTYPIEGRYFYRRYGVTIPLVGMALPDGSFRLREYRRVPNDEFTAEWRLKISANSANGFFCKCDVTQLSEAGSGSQPKISLQRISSEFHRTFGPTDRDTYHKMLLEFPLKTGTEIEVTPEIAYVMQSDPRFKVSRPHLTRFPDSRIMAKINREMAANLRWDRLQASGNLSEAHLEADLGGFYDEETKVSFFLPDILSVLVERSWYWGGAHPNQSTYSLDYDLHTGKRFELIDAFKTRAGVAAESEVSALLGKLYLRHYVKPRNAYEGPYEKPSGELAQMDCKQIVRENASGKDEPFAATLYLSTKGLVIAPVLPYILQDCAPEVTIAYAELRPFVKRNSILRALVDGNTSN